MSGYRSCIVEIGLSKTQKMYNEDLSNLHTNISYQRITQ